MLINVYTDGASRSNPGESASGYAIFDESHKQLLQYAFYNGIKTNNQAEYLALLAALAKVAELYGYDCDVEAFTDSVLMARQMGGSFMTKDKNLRELKVKAQEYSSRFRSFKIKSLPRENAYIAGVDRALNELLDQMAGNKA